MPKPLELTGKKFNRVTVNSLNGNINGKTQWNCTCDCGNVLVVVGSKLVDGSTKSCGCLRIENSIKATTKHGMRYSKEYHVWCCMKARCDNENNKDYKSYGERGITYDPSWNDFQNFINALGERPSDDHTLERIDNSKGYTPDNCRWATMKEQSNNRRSNVKLSFNGKDLTVSQFAEELGIPRATVVSRLEKGIPLEEIKNVEEVKKYNYNGKLMSIPEIAKETGIYYRTLLYRLNNNWSFEDAIKK